MLQALIPFYAVLFIALGLLSLMAALTGTFDHTVAKGLNMFNRSFYHKIENKIIIECGRNIVLLSNFFQSIYNEFYLGNIPFATLLTPKEGIQADNYYFFKIIPPHSLSKQLFTLLQLCPPSAHSTLVLLVCAFVHGAQAAIRLYLPSTLYR